MRKRYYWDDEQQKLVEMRPRPRGEARVEIISDEPYAAGTVMSDGTVIQSKAGYREYLKRTGSTHASDFTEHWKKAEKEREKVTLGQHDIAGRTQDIVEAMKMVEQGYRPRPRDGSGFEVMPHFIPGRR